MKVLMNAISARRGGIATYTRNMIATLPREGVDAKIAVPPDLASTDPSATIAVEIGRYGAVRRFFWDQMVWRRTVEAEKPDVLFSSANFGLLNSPVRQLLLMREGGLFNPYYLDHVFPTLRFRTQQLHRLRRRLMQMSIRHADAVMFPSATLRDWVARFEPSVMARAVVNSYGINLDRFTPRDDAPPGGQTPLRVLYVSVYYPHKDPLTFARAISILRSRGRAAVGRITMDRDEFGPWPNRIDEYEALLKHQSDGDVTLGSVNSQALPALYSASDIFVFPSISETFGFPLVEAMASGVPVIAADTLINREVCGPAALYFPPQDAGLLAERINDLAERRDLYQWLRIEGLKRARERYSWNAHLGRLVGIFRNMVRQ
jgi:glycosyltransferase involved in cell wall biosynthesis